MHFSRPSTKILPPSSRSAPFSSLQSFSFKNSLLSKPAYFFNGAPCSLLMQKKSNFSIRIKQGNNFDGKRCGSISHITATKKTSRSCYAQKEFFSTEQKAEEPPKEVAEPVMSVEEESKVPKANANVLNPVELREKMAAYNIEKIKIVGKKPARIMFRNPSQKSDDLTEEIILGAAKSVGVPKPPVNPKYRDYKYTDIFDYDAVGKNLFDPIANKFRPPINMTPGELREAFKYLIEVKGSEMK